ncbi:MAG: sterol desaturase family protein [Flavobacteriales bacterium]|jgi:sterol desaturase/sphingolipid hydroxylase (fatty acid hydroxylase superfamily)|nr:sterol desaturase family protein [Flavobacteriales bacterium]
METFINSFWGSVDWTWRMISFDVEWNNNYFYGLIIISLIAWGLELAFPWRKNQAAIRKDFWLDGFYMFFNFFVFSIVISGVYQLLSNGFESIGLTMQSIGLIDLSPLHSGIGLLVFFIINDFVQWFTHIMLHKFPIFWRFHKVHHSVQEMGFAAHLRYHWMENILYKPLKTLVVMLLGGFEPEQAFIVHFITIAIGHLNHANVKITWGPLKYLFNNPVMHLWHHSKDLPEGQNPGVNFGISLSLWDYVFKTAHVPEDSGTIKLGFDGIEDYPTSNFFKQLASGFGNR